MTASPGEQRQLLRPRYLLWQQPTVQNTSDSRCPSNSGHCCSTTSTPSTAFLGCSSSAHRQLRLLPPLPVCCCLNLERDRRPNHPHLWPTYTCAEKSGKRVCQLVLQAHTLLVTLWHPPPDQKVLVERTSHPSSIPKRGVFFLFLLI